MHLLELVLECLMLGILTYDAILFPENWPNQEKAMHRASL